MKLCYDAAQSRAVTFHHFKIIGSNSVTTVSKNQTDYSARMMKVLTYIQQHIDEELTLEQLATVACFSRFHFHRIFAAFVGESLRSYIRRLRIEKAAGKIRFSEMPITDIALSSGYETPAAFTKAFKQIIGVSPREFRVQSQPIIHSIKTLTENEVKEFNLPWKIEQLNDLTIFFVRRTGKYETASFEAWEVMLKLAHLQQWLNEKTRFLSIAHDNPTITHEDHLRFDACVTVEKTMQPIGEVGKRVIKAGRYVCFTHLGSYETLEESFRQIFVYWLPQTYEILQDSEGFLEKVDGFETNNTSSHFKIYLPLR